MANIYYCSHSRLIVGGKSLEFGDLDALTIRELSKLKIEMYGSKVRLEQLANGDIRFDFKGVDHHRTYNAKKPAKVLLEDLRNLGTYFDPHTNQLYF